MLFTLKGMEVEIREKNTVKNDFYLENGSTVQADFMQQTNTALFASNELFSAIRLPYGQGNFNMYVFLPHTDKTLQDITDNLNKENWEMDGKFFRTKRKHSVPKI